MARHQPFQIIGYHSCDRELGLKILNGETQLKPSRNSWDWLGPGIYFWEQDPIRAFTYALECSQGTQQNKTRIETPFVLGAIIQLGNCLNLVESESLQILSAAYDGLHKISELTGQSLPVNKGSVRKLDCAVIKFIHQTNKIESKPEYQTIRSAFQEGGEAYPGASFAARDHIQVCVLDDSLIKGYFLPRPLEEFNPWLRPRNISKK